jgi:hypothetical protein
MSQNEQNIYFQNKNVHFGDCRMKVFAVFGRFGPNYCVACPENGHSCFENKCFTVFGTWRSRYLFCCIPSKQQNFYFQNKNVSFRDNNHNDIILLHPLKTAKLLFRKQESMV